MGAIPGSTRRLHLVTALTTPISTRVLGHRNADQTGTAILALATSLYVLRRCTHAIRVREMHFQFSPHDEFDYDSVQVRSHDLTCKQSAQGHVIANRTGFLRAGSLHR